jgi:two-component system phosphate regulon sensor histidine kinase PhoR
MKRRLLWQLIPSYLIIIAMTLMTYIWLEVVDSEHIVNRIGLFVVAASVGVLLAFFFARLLVEPLRLSLLEIRRGTDYFARGEFSRRISVVEPKELHDLAHSLNRMSSELKSQVAESESRLGELTVILGAMREGVIVLDHQYNLARINEAALGLLALTADQVLGKPVYGVIRNVALQAILDQAISEKRPSEGDVVLVDPSERTVQVYACPLEGPTGEGGLLIVLNDITHIQRLENVRREFVANVSHELRTPITSIKGFVETLLDGAAQDPEESRRFLEIIARQVERLIAIFDDLLSLSRIEQQEGREELQFQQVVLKDFLEAALQPFEQKAREKKIALILETTSEEVALNRNLMEQAISNLVDNALKLSPDSSTLTVRGGVHLDQVEFAVVDRGPGIEREHLPRIFERFYRVDRGRSRKQGGTGLGLSIVKHIAQLHRGSVDVHSIVGEGSSFFIRIPRR